MSSFIISSIDYSRVAGVIAAIGTEQNNYREPMFYKYAKRNDGSYGLYNEEDFKNEIFSLYHLNVVSVNDQYDDNAQEDEFYPNEYKKYFDKTKSLLRHYKVYGGLEFKNLLTNINQFFDSVSYQIEEEDCSRKALEIINWYKSAILGLLLKRTSESLSWGEFSYFEEQ